MSCPICGKAVVQTYRPFCSSRCADRDLVNWLNGSYAIPSTNLEDIENAQQEIESRQKDTPIQ